MNRYHISRPQKFKMLLLWVDVLVLMAALAVSFQITPYIGISIADQILEVFWSLDRIAVHMFVFLLTFYSLGMYSYSRPRRNQYPALLMAVFVGGAVNALLTYIVASSVAQLYAAALYGSTSVVMIIAWRVMFLKFIENIVNAAKVLVVGSKEAIEFYVDKLDEYNSPFYKITTVAIASPGAGYVTRKGQEYANIDKLLDGEEFDIIAMDMDMSEISLAELSGLLRRRILGKEVHDILNLYIYITGRYPANISAGKSLLFSLAHSTQLRPNYLRVKRLYDIIISLTILILSTPAWIVIALLIKVSSPGPIFFVQERLGKNLVPFPCLKFRTMSQDAEKGSGPQWSQKGDPRITFVGGYLRASRLDELPQLINILRGEMSFIGPRAIRDHFRKIILEEIPLYDTRFLVKPGLTGWAQVMGGYFGSVEEQKTKFEFDLFYLEHMSLSMDLYITIKTIRALILTKGM